MPSSRLALWRETSQLTTDSDPARRFSKTKSLMKGNLPIILLIGRPTPRVRRIRDFAWAAPTDRIRVGAEPFVRVNTRFDDGVRGERYVEGNGSHCCGRRPGPGGHKTDSSAGTRLLCVHLTSRKTERRLPMSHRAFGDCPAAKRSCGRSRAAVGMRAGHGTRNANAQATTAVLTKYPAVGPFAPLIYLWTADEASQDRAWILVYDGGVFAKPKAVGSPSFGFRAVR